MSDHRQSERPGRSRRSRAYARRSVLGGLLAAGTIPLWRPALAHEPEVVVIGAGAAGLAAARTLIARGRSVVVVEARGRIGGRAWTDHATFGVPYDWGCSWLHQANRNPFKKMADAWGYATLYHDNAEERVFAGARPATSAERAAYEAAWTALNRAVSQAGHAGRDVPAASVSPRGMPWIGTAEAWLGPLDMGMDVEDFSCLDWYMMEDLQPNYLIREGFGTLVAQFGRGLPVRLNTPAERVRWGGPGVVVETPAGDIRARAAIITVSTGVLASGRLAFDPPLPVWKQDAIGALPMGLLATVPLQFRPGTRFGLPENGWLAYRTDGREACFFLCWPWGRDLMVGWVGGRFGWALTGAGEAEAVDYARRALGDILGRGEVDRAFVKGGFARWGTDPWTLGAYASAIPGSYAARALMAKRVGERLFFAGEACAGGFAQTCGGAFMSGQATARAVHSALG